MTVKDLSQLFYINREIEQDRKRLVLLESRATSTTPVYGCFPSSGHNADCKVEKYASEAADVRTMISKRMELYWLERKRLETYIDGIKDSHTRQIFRLRFCDLKTWNQVADEIGGDNTEDSVKKAAYRYINSHD